MPSTIRLIALILCAAGLAWIDQWFIAQLYLIAALWDAGVETKEEP